MPNSSSAPNLVLAAHGTASAAGHQTLITLVRNLHALRPGLSISLGFVDILLPTVEDVLDALRATAIVVPTLLSTGYHVSSDIPRSVRKLAAIARHLGPDPLLTAALVDRLADARGSNAIGPVVLVAAGSSDPAAQTELEAAAADLAATLGVPVRPATLSTPDLDLRGVEVASYLLAEGRMAESLVTRAAESGARFTSSPIGTHPAVAELILRRYDETL